MLKQTRALTGLLFISVMVASCNLPNSEKMIIATQTALVQTVEAGVTQTAAAKPTDTLTPLPSPTPLATMAAATLPPSLPTLPPLPTSAPAVTPCNRASFVADVTVPDGTKLTPGASFTKTWRLQNTGTCTWTTSYSVVYVSGNMTGPDSTALTTTVAPGGSTDISVSMTAPATANTYYAYFRLRAPDGTQFGVVQNSSGAFYVQVIVSGGTATVTPTPTGLVTPTISSLNPASVAVNSAQTTLTVNGSNFVSGAVVKWETISLATTFYSANQLTAVIPAGYLTGLGNVNVTVVNPSGATSAKAVFTVTSVTYPAPTISSIDPTSTTANGLGFNLTVYGSNFVSGATVYFSGTAISTTYVSASQLNASVPQAQVASAGNYPVYVINPAPGGGQSNSATFKVTSPVSLPTISGVSPATFSNGADATITITGTDFSTVSSVSWNGGALAFSIVNANTLTATVPGANLTASGAAVIIVNNAVGSSNAYSLAYTVQ